MEWNLDAGAKTAMGLSRITLLVATAYLTVRAVMSGLPLGILWAGLALLFSALFIASLKWPRKTLWASAIVFAFTASAAFLWRSWSQTPFYLEGLVTFGACLVSLRAAILFHRLPQDEVRL
ncbi:hypothetical protein [Maricaulis salignorans]|uniref:hypothetical protein n=1 Tax=Maricaulis salignorans TaxID=144026 RepID=UPI001F1D72C3|nr:hypothetical protein [Maricaulis salignorans]